MRHPRLAGVAVAGLVAIALCGCETMGRQSKRTPQDILTSEAQSDGKKAAEPEKWSPGTWSRQGRDIEKSVMRNTADANWSP